MAKFQFIDLFAGIGGTRIAFEEAGGECVFSSEWDKHCQNTYEANYGEKPYGDINKIDEKDIPDHDILVAGFPCQPFSIAGISKKLSLGRKHGFEDEKQGNLFFEIARILKEKKPKAILLENVKNLKNHDGGNTFKVIRATLEKLGYTIYDRIIDAKHYVPQHRERIFIVGFRKEIASVVLFKYPEPKAKEIKIKNILEKKVDTKYTLSDKLWSYLQKYAEKHRKQGNGFGYGLIDPRKDTITRTLSARYYKDGSEILIRQKGRNPRRLTPAECSRLMGFPKWFKMASSDTQAYKQFGNSVVVPLVHAIAKNIVREIDKTK
jgi:DNA (cytosine-5)-methyltransferase 1